MRFFFTREDYLIFKYLKEGEMVWRVSPPLIFSSFLVLLKRKGLWGDEICR